MSVQRFFLHDGKPFEQDNFNLPLHFDACIYEVVRVTEGVILFAEDHVDRLFGSFGKKGMTLSLDRDQVLDELYQVVRLNNNAEGNIRYDVYVSNGHMQRWAYYVPHVYPPLSLYQHGVKLVTLRAERSEPAVKILYFDLRKQAEELMRQSGSYEVVLVDDNQYITEGSKSNLFFIRNNKIYTAPDELVLSGITRKKVIEIITRLSLPLIYDPVKYSELSQYEAAFLTGTSPKVLPVRKIDMNEFAVNHPLTLQLMREYDGMIRNYIDAHKS